MSSAASRKLTRREFVATATAVVGLSVYGTSSNALEATRTALPGASEPQQPLRIALLTDMHGPHNWVNQAELVTQVTRFQPDIVCIVGDAVDRRGDEHYVNRYTDLPARLGKFATTGNWEYQGECDLDRLRRQYERAGVRLLINERLRLDTGAGGPLDLIGLDDWRAGNPDYRLVAGLPPAAPGAGRAVVLSHCPVAFDAIVRAAPRPTAVLAGHTHGGQIAPFGLALVLPEGSGRYVKGVYRSRDRAHTLYVSRGLGNSGPPFRFGSRPELALVVV
jgi:predicted MPP superfamily phosphohydrolase